MTAATLTLTDFLLARIAEDESAASDVIDDMSRWDHPSWRAQHDPDSSFPAERMSLRMSPARVLAECEAKRRIVEAAIEVDAHQGGSAAMVMHGCSYTPGILPLLAAVYAEHPDYRDEWRNRD